ncbi:MAG: ParB/RepB/Spo0J family partition protein [Clostridia bacterium]|nr:ParB/RepB/Spo0J family partition protein [Clostridia bacterium]
MQDFYTKIRQTYAQEHEQGQLFLRPEQIQSKTARKSGHDTNAIIRLAESIKKYGIIKPLSVKKCGEGQEFGGYELVDGEKRLRAAILAGVAKVPCFLLPQDDKSHAITGILEHLRGKELNMFEQAAGFRLLMQDFSMTQAEIAQKLGVSQSSIANKLRLLGLSHEEQRAILSYGLTERHARSVLRLKEPKMRAFALHKIREERLNVAATEDLIEKLLDAASNKRKTEREALASGDEKQGREIPQNRGEGVQNDAFFTVLSPQTPPKGCIPRKFAIPDLTPLYNSIERTLSIFRKTGATVSCMREESADGVRIVIEIPKNA